MELDPRSTALIAVHLQGDVVGPDGAFSNFFHNQVVERDVLATIASLAGTFRAAGSPVVYTRVAWKPDFSDLRVNSPILGIVAQSGCLKDGSELAAIVEPVAPAEGDVVVTHTRVGGFQDSELDAVLKQRGIDTVCFVGVATNFSVEGTARVASDLGYRVVVVEDACSAADEATHAASINSLSLLAEITTAEAITEALNSTTTASA
ncbi:cysteine hydrolase family protein [Aldersonia kunmingensis]|uniref:cysteine hydrolase family protein n=1 Tax=Aldersonia kunmingensis TaxID=408066 RepID=UPI0008311FD3|nr:isochorismatase family cysteine hydrolase [Aldersonia kunmingensis]